MLEHGAGVGAEAAPDAQQRDALDRRVGQRVAERALQEAHAVVEQVEALEAVAHQVEVGLEAGDAVVGELRRLRRGSGDGAEPVGDPHLAVGHLVGVEVGRA